MIRRKADSEMPSCKRCGKHLRSSIFRPSSWKHECGICDDRYYCGACLGKWAGTPVCGKCYKGLQTFKITIGTKFVGYKIVNEYKLITVETVFRSMSDAEDEMTIRAYRIGANAVTNFGILDRQEMIETHVSNYAKKTSLSGFEKERRTNTYYGAQGMAVTLQKCSRPAKKKVRL